MRRLSIGKTRGLQRLSNEHGIMTMCALDHRGSLQRMLAAGTGREVSYRDMVEFKLDLCRAVAGHASAILLDPLYGAGQAVSAGLLPASTGLLVSLEQTGYSGRSEARITQLLPDWNARKAKRMGADAAKLLLYYRPDNDVAAQQRKTVEELARDCAAEDLALVVEPLSYPAGTGENSPPGFARVKPELVIETARQISALPIDLLKAEFPADLEYEREKRRPLDLCLRLNEATPVPWVILSAGVGFDLFCRQVEIACEAGASGFLAGRALWQEAAELGSREERLGFLEETVIPRLRTLTRLANEKGTPWHTRVRADDVDESWYGGY